jgi:hypothetical protein
MSHPIIIENYNIEEYSIATMLHSGSWIQMPFFSELQYCVYPHVTYNI